MQQRALSLMCFRRAAIGSVFGALIGAMAVGTPPAAWAADNTPPEGFVALFNGRDLEGWKGLMRGPLDNPARRAQATPEQLAEAQKEADENMRAHWRVEDGALVFDGKGRSLVTAKDYGDFELYVDWKILPGGDSGIYLRGTPQVQIWDRPEGSGGLYNNQKNPSKPTKKADRAVGEWNTFHIKMVGDRVSVRLNGELVVDDVVMENYWERDKPIYPSGPIELQNHGNTLWFKNIYLREIPPATRLSAQCPSRRRELSSRRCESAGVVDPPGWMSFRLGGAPLQPYRGERRGCVDDDAIAGLPGSPNRGTFPFPK